MRICISNPHIIDQNHWFILQLIEQAGNIDKFNIVASIYYVANCINFVNLNSSNFIKIWEIEKNMKESALVRIVKYRPMIINKNSWFLRQLLNTAKVLDNDNKSTFHYALKAKWKINY